MHPTECLRNEHQIILIVLSCFEIALARARQSGCVQQVEFEPFVEFFRGFADKCHHCKEEDRLFPCLERKGIPREGGPIGVMLYEHEQARKHVRTIAGTLGRALTKGKPRRRSSRLRKASRGRSVRLQR